MKKRCIGITAVAAALTLSASMTAFAGQWKEDSVGRYYENDNGSRAAYAGSWTCPDDGFKYAFDPDGYVIRDGYFGGSRTDATGRIIEKTEEELLKEAQRREARAARPTPGKAHNAATAAGLAAKTATSAVTTTRLAYQAEMKTLGTTIFTDMRKQLGSDYPTLKIQTIKNNIEHTYNYNLSNSTVISSSLRLSSNKDNPLMYEENAYELRYNRSMISDATLAPMFNEMYQKLLVASLGEVTGKTVYDTVMAQQIGSGTPLDLNGATDTGNYYALTYRNDLITLKVTCSEYVAPTAEEIAAAEAAAAAAAAEAEAAAAAEAAQTTTSSVLVAGQGASTTVAETTAAETEAAAQ